MFNKNDPLVQAVQGVMKENAFRRRVEEQLNEELGIASKKALPHEQHAEYDALLEQRLEEAGRVLPDLTQKKEEPKPSKEYAQRMKDDKDKKKSSENERARAAGLFKGSKKSTVKEALHPNQQKLDVHEPEKDKLTAQDFKMLRAKKAMSEEEGDETREGGAVVDTKTGKAVVSPTAPKASEGPSAEDKAALTKKIEAIKEEQIDEISRDLASRYIKKAKESTKDAYYGSDAPTMGKRNKGIDLALMKKWGDKKYGLPEPKVKATNEESVQIDESDFYQKAQSKMIKNALNRKKSTEKPEPSFYQKAQSKMIKNALNRKKSTTNEEVEQLDEISKGKLASYIKKASHDIATKSAAVGRYADRANRVSDEMKKGDYSNYKQGKKDNEFADKMFAKSWKRRANIALAADKLAKESVDLSKIKMDKSTGKISSSDPKIDLSKISMNMSTGKLSSLKEKTQLDEKAVSKAQQKLFGIALATRRGETDKGSEAATKLAADMPEKELLKFAKTKRKGLPEKVKKIEEDIDSVMEEIRANLGEEAYAALMNEAPLVRRPNPMMAAARASRTAFNADAKNREAFDDRDNADIASASASNPRSGNAPTPPKPAASLPSPAQRGITSIRGALNQTVGATPTSGPRAGVVPSPVSRENQTPPGDRAAGTPFRPQAIAKIGGENAAKNMDRLSDRDNAGIRDASASNPRSGNAPTPPKPAAATPPAKPEPKINVPMPPEAKPPTSQDIARQAIRAPVQSAKGEGKTGVALAQSGVSREQRRSQEFVNQTLGADKGLKAGSAESNIALQKHFAGLKKAAETPEPTAATSTPAPRPAPAPAAATSTGGSTGSATSTPTPRPAPAPAPAATTSTGGSTGSATSTPTPTPAATTPTPAPKPEEKKTIEAGAIPPSNVAESFDSFVRKFVNGKR